MSIISVIPKWAYVLAAFVVWTGLVAGWGYQQHKSVVRTTALKIENQARIDQAALLAEHQKELDDVDNKIKELLDEVQSSGECLSSDDVDRLSDHLGRGQ